MKAAFIALLLSLPAAALADTSAIPVTEKEFVDSMGSVKPDDLRKQFGEPEKVTEIRDKNTGDVYGSVWHYHNLNTKADGQFYKSTMLDIVDDAVVTVVFSDE